MTRWSPTCSPRRARRHAAVAAGEELTVDLLAILAAARVPHDAAVREVVLFLAASTLNNASLVTHVVDELHGWFDAHPGDRGRTGDRAFLRAAMVEALRLHVPTPALIRRASTDLVLASSGRTVAAGEEVALDLEAANRDPGVFGDDPDGFRPGRAVRPPEPGYGLVFGGGGHVCLGRAQVVGSYAEEGADTEGMLLRVCCASSTPPASAPIRTPLHSGPRACTRASSPSPSCSTSCAPPEASRSRATREEHRHRRRRAQQEPLVGRHLAVHEHTPLKASRRWVMPWVISRRASCEPTQRRPAPNDMTVAAFVTPLGALGEAPLGPEHSASSKDQSRRGSPRRAAAAPGHRRDHLACRTRRPPARPRRRLDRRVHAQRLGQHAGRAASRSTVQPHPAPPARPNRWRSRLEQRPTRRLHPAGAEADHRRSSSNASGRPSYVALHRRSADRRGSRRRCSMTGASRSPRA